MVIVLLMLKNKNIMIHKGIKHIMIFNNLTLNLIDYNYKKLFIIIYKMNRNYIRDNITLVSIVLFIIIFVVISIMKPAFLFKKDGSIREFGIGYKNKTIFPIWLLSIILGILCYLFVMYYITYPKFF